MKLENINERIKEAIHLSIREGYFFFYQIGRSFYICLEGRDSLASEEEASFLRNLILHELAIPQGRNGEYIPSEKLISLMKEM